MTVFLTRPERIGNGIPLAVKDLFDTAGLRTTYGSALFDDHVPGRTAEAVGRLEAAGYSNVGKTNLHEFAYGVSSHNPHFGAVENPLDPGRTAGGSSSGSAAAVAAGLAEAALAPGFERAELGSLAELVVGVAWLEHAEPLVRARLEAAAELFPHRRAVAFPLPEGIGKVFMREVAESHRGLFPEQADAYGENVRAKLERCVAVTDAELGEGRNRLEEYRERAAAALSGIDLLIAPTLAFVAPPAVEDDREIRDAVIRFTYPFNALGWPALALPCGPAEGGLPASVQLVAPAGEDARVLAAGALLEAGLRRQGTWVSG